MTKKELWEKYEQLMQDRNTTGGVFISGEDLFNYFSTYVLKGLYDFLHGEYDAEEDEEDE